MSREQEVPMFLITRYGDKDERALVEVNVRLDSTNASPFGDKLNDLIDKGAQDITVDLSKIGYVSSAGLREMAAAYKKIRAKTQKDDRIKVLVSPSAHNNTVLDVLNVTGLSSIFEVTVLGGQKK